MEGFLTVSGCAPGRHLLGLWAGLLLPLKWPCFEAQAPEYLTREGGVGSWGWLLVRHLPRTLGLSFQSVVRICGLESQSGANSRFWEDCLPSVSSMENGSPAVNPFLC